MSFQRRSENLSNANLLLGKISANLKLPQKANREAAHIASLVPLPIFVLFRFLRICCKIVRLIGLTGVCFFLPFSIFLYPIKRIFLKLLF